MNKLICINMELVILITVVNFIVIATTIILLIKVDLFVSVPYI
jgi:hypothetical protein